MEKDNLSSLYNALISKGYSTDDLGDENTFRSKMADKNNRKDLYDYVSGRGDFRIGDYDSYENRLTGDIEGNTSKAGPKAQEVVDEYDSFKRANVQNRMQELMRKQDNEPKPRKTLQDIVSESSTPVEQNILNREPISREPAYTKGEERNYRPDIFERMKYDSSIRDEDAAVDKEYTPKVEEKEEDVFENYRNRFGLTQRGAELQEELAQIQSDLQNKYSKEFENTPEYKAIVEKKYNTQEEIDAANKALNDAYNKKYGAVINKEIEPYLKAYEGEIFQRYAPRIQEGLRTVAKNDTSKEVKALTGEVDELLEKQHKLLRSKGPSSGNAMSALMGSRAYNQSTVKERQELGALEASQRLLEQSQEIIEEAGKKGNTNFFAGLGRGFRDNMDIENFTFGLSEMADSKYLNRALEKAEKGEKLTPAEEKLLEASVVNMATYGYFSSDLGRGYGAGSTTAVSLPFMLEFIANPISGSGNAIAKGLLKFGLKKFGRASAQTASKGALNAFGRGIASNTGKFAGRLAGDAAAALGMEGTTGLGRVAAGTLDRLNENYDYSLDDNGQLQVRKTGDTSIRGAFARSAASKFFENQSEMVLNAFKGWSPFMKAVDKALPGRMNEFLNRIKNSKPGELYRELKNNPTFREIVKRAQFHGQGEEYLEEVYNNLANVAMGEMTMEDALDLDNNIDTFLGLAPTSVMFGLFGLGSMAADRLSNRKKMRALFEKMTPEQQAKLTELTRMSKERSNEDIKKFIEITIADKDLTTEQKKDEIEYAFELAKQNAIEDLQQEQTKEQDVQQQAAQESGAAVYEIHNPQEMRSIVLRQQVARQRLSQTGMSDEDIDRLEQADNQTRAQMLDAMETSTRRLASDYLTQSDALSSMENELDRAHAPEVEEARVRISQMNPLGGNITLIPLDVHADKTHQYGVVLNGLNPDGTIPINTPLIVAPIESLNGQPSFSTFGQAANVSFIPRSASQLTIIPQDEVLTSMLGNYQADADILDGSPITLGATFPVMSDDGSIGNITVTGQDPATGQWIITDEEGKQQIPVSDEDLRTRKEEAEKIPILEEYRKSDEEYMNSRTPLEALGKRQIPTGHIIIPTGFSGDEVSYDLVYEDGRIIDSGSMTMQEFNELEPYEEQLVGQPEENRNLSEKEGENAIVSRDEESKVSEDGTDYTLSDKTSDNGEPFYQDNSGNIDLAVIPQEVFDAIGKKAAPFRIIPSMLKHVFDRHGREMSLEEPQDAILFVLDVMDNFDHVRKGDKGALIFSIENGRSRTGKRAVTVLIDSKNGDYYGIKTSGYERIDGLQKRALLWEKGANETSTTGVAPANVTTAKAQQGNRQSGSASNQSNALSENKDTQKSSENQEVNVNNSIQFDEKGNPLYHKAPVETTVAYLSDGSLTDEEIDLIVAANQAEANKQLEKIIKDTPKIVTNKEKYVAAKKAWQAKVDDARQQSEYWKEVASFIKQQREQPGDKITEEILSMGEPLNELELAAQKLANGSLPLLYEDYKRELGFSNEEAGKMFGLFKSRENGGLTIEEAGEVLMQNDLEEGSNFFDQEDANAGRNAILEVLSSARTRGDLIEYIRKKREAASERERRSEEEYDEEQREAWAQENFGMSYADYVTFEEVINDIIQEKALSKEAIQEFYDNFADEFNNWNNGRITEETTVNERGSVDSRSESSEGLLPTEQLSDNRGIETDISAEADERADNKGVPASEESIITEIETAREQVDTNPSDAQKEAGNYKKGHIKLDGYDITIENPKGSERSGTDADGNKWSITMNNDYGYIRGTESLDGDHIDIFLSDNPAEGNVYVIDQLNTTTGEFDEHKVMYGFSSMDEATQAYLSNYSPGWQGLGAISEVSKDEFKKWIDSSHRKTKPFVDYKSVKVEEAQSENQGKITAEPVSQLENGGKTEVKLPQSKSNAKNKKRAADVKQARYELMDAKRELSVAQATNSGYTPEEVEEKKKRVEEAESKLKDLTNKVPDENVASATDNIREFSTENDDIRFRIVHHGTGASFDKFTTEKIGTGEGNAAFGWGLYFTEKKDIAQYYAETIGNMPSYVLYKDGKPADMNDEISRIIYNYDGDVKKAIRDNKRNAKMWEKEGDKDFASTILETVSKLQKEDPKAWEMKEEGNRHIYDVEIPDTGFINWDKTIPEEQKKQIQDQAEKEGLSFSFYGDAVSPKEYFEKAGMELEGFQLYKSLTDALGSDKAASLFLNRARFNGIEYEAGRHSANKKGNEMNFVVFDENAVRIIDHLRYRLIGEQETANLDKVPKQREIIQTVEDLSDKLNTPIHITRSLDEIPDGSAKRAIEEGRKVKAWFAPKSNEVVFYLPNATDVNDAIKSVLHEIVGHKGLRELLVAENVTGLEERGKAFDDAMRKLYGQLPVNVQEVVKDSAKKNYNGDISIAMDEYLAEQAEKNETPTWWDKVVATIHNLLRKLGINVKLSANDVKYLLWESQRKLRASDIPMDVARETIMRSKLGIGEFEQKETEASAIEIENQEIRYRITDDSKKKISELNSRIDSLERKISKLENREELRRSVTDFIRKEVRSDLMGYLDKQDLNSLLLQAQNAKSNKSLEKIVMNVKNIMLNAQRRRLQRVTDRLLSLKVQDVNGKNMSIAKNVDDSTRKIFSFLRGKASNLALSGFEDEMKYIRREIRDKQQEIARLKNLLGTAKKEEEKQQLSEQITSLSTETEDLKAKLNAVIEEAETVKEQVLNQGDIDVDAEMKRLGEKLGDAAIGKDTWTQGDTERMAALNILSSIITNKKHDGEIEAIEIDKQKLLLNNSDLFRKRIGKNETERKRLTDQINENYRRIVAYNRLVNDIRSMQVKQMEMTIEQLNELVSNGKNSLLRKTEEENKRKRELVGKAIRSVEGNPINIFKNNREKENWMKKFFSAPLGSFEYMCRRVNTKTLGKDGFLYKRFIEGGEGVLHAYNTYVLGMKEFRTRLNDKCEEIFGMDFEKIASLSDKPIENSGVYVIQSENERVKGYGARYELPLTKGQAMYIYQVWKMNDGRTKLELQGFDEESIKQIVDFMGPQYVKFADWVQDEFLKEMRDKYNAKYLEMYNTSLAEIKNYIPLKIRKEAVRQDSYLSENGEKRKTLEEKAGSLINRTANTKPVDITCSGFDILLDHGNQMEEWNAYARVRKDLDYILSSTEFRNQLNANVRGSFENFYDAAEVATKSNHPDSAKYGDMVLGKLSKGIVGGNIAFRLNTALKQVLSAPAFLGYSQSPAYMWQLSKAMVTPYGSFKWCMENIPSFYERVNSGTIGNEKLDEKGFSKLMDKYIEIGMIPNKLVDAITCSLGAKSIYEYKFAQLKEAGVTKEEAHRQALAEADIYYNATQQSSHPAFLSPMQMSRTLTDRMLTTYQNSNIGYVRRLMGAFYDLTRSLKWNELKANYTKIYMEEGMSEKEAENKAYRRLLNENRKNIVELALFGWGLNLLWNIGSQGLLGFFRGDDDDEDKKWTKDLAFLLTSPMKGLPGGNLLESMASGYGMNPFLMYEELDKFMEELNKTIDDYGLISPEIAYITLAKASRYAGVDLEVWGNIYLGVEGMTRDGALDDDKLIDIMYMLNSPKSSRETVAKNLYKDESVLEYAQKIARAMKYIPKENKYEIWVPGVKPFTERKEKEIKKEAKILQMSPEEKEKYDKKELLKEHHKKMRSLKDDQEALQKYKEKHKTELEELTKEVLGIGQ